MKNMHVAVVATGGGLLRAPLLSDELIAFKFDDGADEKPNVVQASPNPATSESLAATSGVPWTVQDLKTKAILRRQAALLPRGHGRSVTIRACSSCHDLDTFTNQRLTPQEWTNVVQTMSAMGTRATSSELKIIQSYLAHAFPRGSAEE